ncbi:hypothetical protein DVH24_025157 [Malus domestica]|uniref:Uncharacterized protein n=1 Tax=Malus domestica TaxID=3750 RepID=A0A498HJK5_MALDO|nr:hypothetical protein DVH24_025157 [Malus domestica]
MEFQGIRKSILPRLMTFHLHRHGRDSQIPILLLRDLFRHPIIRNMDIRVTSMRATNRHFRLPRRLSARTIATTNTMAALPSLMACESFRPLLRFYGKSIGFALLIDVSVLLFTNCAVALHFVAAACWRTAAYRPIIYKYN